jgi:probable F420-dependent oxidoreductase
MPHPRPFRFGLLAASAPTKAAWLDIARKAEDLGCSTLLVPDHFPKQLSPMPALAAAAAVTTDIRLGTLVAANDFRHPAMLAKEAATLDVLSDGRFELGLGAGWLDEDYSMTGIPHDRAGVRIERMIEAVEILRGFWGAEAFSFAGEHYMISDLDGTPKPVQTGGPKLVVGGGGKRMLSTAARLADIVGLNPNVGAGTVGAAAFSSMSADATDEKLRWVQAAAGDRFDDIEIGILKLAATVTDDRDTAATTVGEGMGMDADGIVESPHTLIGSTEQIIEELRAQRERWHLSYVTLRDDLLDDFAPVIARLSGV